MEKIASFAPVHAISVNSVSLVHSFHWSCVRMQHNRNGIWTDLSEIWVDYWLNPNVIALPFCMCVSVVYSLELASCVGHARSINICIGVWIVLFFCLVRLEFIEIVGIVHVTCRQIKREFTRLQRVCLRFHWLIPFILFHCIRNEYFVPLQGILRNLPSLATFCDETCASFKTKFMTLVCEFKTVGMWTNFSIIVFFSVDCNLHFLNNALRKRTLGYKMHFSALWKLNSWFPTC